MSDTQTQQSDTPPLDGPTANEDEVDKALFGPYEDDDQ